MSLKKNDIIYNEYLCRFFRVVEARVLWDRDREGKAKTPSKCEYRKWVYLVEPIDELWFEPRIHPITGDKRYWLTRDIINSRKHGSKIPGYKYVENMSSIYPMTFEKKGFRLLSKKQRRATKVLYSPS